MPVHSMLRAHITPAARTEAVSRRCTARKPFVIACGTQRQRYLGLSPVHSGRGRYETKPVVAAAHKNRQPQERYASTAATDVAQHLLGGLAAAALLLAPQAALANARLPPLDSGELQLRNNSLA